MSCHLTVLRVFNGVTLPTWKFLAFLLWFRYSLLHLLGYFAWFERVNQWSVVIADGEIFIVYLQLHINFIEYFTFTDTSSLAPMLVGYYCSVMAAFKRCLIQTDNKDMLNVVNLYVDIETYCNIDSSSPGSEKKREEQAALISRLVPCVCVLGTPPT